MKKRIGFVHCDLKPKSDAHLRKFWAKLKPHFIIFWFKVPFLYFEENLFRFGWNTFLLRLRRVKQCLQILRLEGNQIFFERILTLQSRALTLIWRKFSFTCLVVNAITRLTSELLISRFLTSFRQCIYSLKQADMSTVFVLWEDLQI